MKDGTHLQHIAFKDQIKVGGASLTTVGTHSNGFHEEVKAYTMVYAEGIVRLTQHSTGLEVFVPLGNIKSMTVAKEQPKPKKAEKAE